MSVILQMAGLCTGRAGACVVHVPNSWHKRKWSLSLLKKWPSGFFHRRRRKHSSGGLP